jgi:predicted RNase H-like HicB family nuclease
MEQLVIVRPDEDGKYTARSVLVPEVKERGDSETEAVEKLRQSLAAWLASAKVVRVDVPLPGKTGNLWLDYFGYAKDDPQFQDYLEEIQRARQADESQ